MGDLADLPNIGPVVEKQLNDVGIFTYDDLRKTGAKEAWLMIQKKDPSACINRLLALEGAIEGIKKSQLPDVVKEDLRDFCKRNKI